METHQKALVNSGYIAKAWQHLFWIVKIRSPENLLSMPQFLFIWRTKAADMLVALSQWDHLFIFSILKWCAFLTEFSKRHGSTDNWYLLPRKAKREAQNLSRQNSFLIDSWWKHRRTSGVSICHFHLFIFSQLSVRHPESLFLAGNQPSCQTTANHLLFLLSQFKI